MWKLNAPKEPKIAYMFDWEAIHSLESLTPYEIVCLICSAVGVNPETACTRYDRPAPPEPVRHLFKEVTIG